MVACPICDKQVEEVNINRHLDSNCHDLIDLPTAEKPKAHPAAFFTRPAPKDDASLSSPTPVPSTAPPTRGKKRPIEASSDVPPKRPKNAHAPLAERMRPQSLDEVAGQELVGPKGVLRHLIITDRIPSMILWGPAGTGKTTVARLIAQTSGTRFVEINSASTGVAECKKLFTEAKNELSLTGRKTVVFCDEIHRFSKSQQDIFLAPVESGTITLIGATTENPSFKVIHALLSRCRTFTLSKLSDETVFSILQRATAAELSGRSKNGSSSYHLIEGGAMLQYLAKFADGDARTALNLLELTLDLCSRPGTTEEEVKKSLTQTLVYDRAGEQHYDTISAFHKSLRGGDADASLYYLARMLEGGEDPLFIARRMVVMASEDVGLADNNMLPLATAAYTAAEKIGMPECRINLAHCTVALALAEKSTRAYRGLNAAYSAMKDPAIAGLPIPIHLRNAPTELMKELGYGKGYKYNPDYYKGRVKQNYLPEGIQNVKFLEDRDLGLKRDSDIDDSEYFYDIDSPASG
ncbi:P-loop containing nucleoside triphosphate hydrolase protein [Piedraia hortae CBS 480.64]|uniref:P-loop containing nucleoside triphosphate hydrolase protein n=1 Tax=Piedraia hortae CBS 480.64 TaxID=1314780 RepID=A0A6A7C1F0_9PEZI|nr:P-loop containing nucleoside triphosphate hydrolase protein [Piedraia hortae CBS 480.64]